MTASWSLNEIEALAKKAARGSGCSWGVAEDAGRAVRWLEARGLPGAEALVTLLRGSKPSETLAIGCAISDGVFDDTVSEFESLVSPVLLVPFIAWAAQRRGIGLEIQVNSAVIRVDANGGLLEGFDSIPDRGAIVIQSHNRQGNVVGPGHRAHIGCEAIVALEALAHNTYAPATAASREAGAGAGLTDND